MLCLPEIGADPEQFGPENSRFREMAENVPDRAGPAGRARAGFEGLWPCLKAKKWARTSLRSLVKHMQKGSSQNQP